MRPQSTAPISSVTTSAPIPLDSKQNPFNVGFGVIITGVCTFTVEHTFDNILAGATPTWLPNATVASATTNASGNYAFPVTAVRLNVTAYTSGTAVLTVLQGSSQ